jgi:hypothetical protein
MRYFENYKTLRPSWSVVLNGAPGSIINGCSTKFSPLIQYILYLDLSEEHIPNGGKTAIIMFLKKATFFS